MDVRSGVSRARLATLLLERLAVLSIVWLVLVNGAPSSWWVGVPTVAVAVLATLPSRYAAPLVWREVFRFIPFFVVRSLSGGIDVALRALNPRMPLDPTLIEYPLRLPGGLPSVVLANLVNLLPGTLTAELHGGALRVHVIDRRAPFVEEIDALEAAVARMFDVALDRPGR